MLTNNQTISALHRLNRFDSTAILCCGKILLLSINTGPVNFNGKNIRLVRGSILPVWKPFFFVRGKSAWANYKKGLCY